MKEYERHNAGTVSALIFLLVPQVKLPKRLDLMRDAKRAADTVPGLIVANWADGGFRQRLRYVPGGLKVTGHSLMTFSYMCAQ
jgi:hypothetical protein